MKLVVRLACALVLAGASMGSLPREAGAVEQALTVLVEFVVTDVKDRPVANLTAEDVIVQQEGATQRVTVFKAGREPGQYELQYVPESGKAGRVALQLMRPGTRARGLDGPALKPRLILPPSKLAAELQQVLADRPEADDFRLLLSVLRFEAASDGLHHTLAVEVPLAALTPVAKGGQYVGQVQILARLRDGEGREVQRYEVDRSLSAASVGQLQVQRLVWTGQIHLRSGRYELEVVARNPVGSAASVRRLAFEAPEVEKGLRISSAALLHPVDSIVVRDVGREADDPFMIGDEPLMPTLELKTVASPGAKLQFFTILYPDPSSAEPPTLRLELFRDGNVVGSAPLALSSPDERGQIRYAGSMSTRTLRAGEHTLRLLAQQGGMAALAEAPFTVDGSEGTPVRISTGASATPAPTRMPAAPDRSVDTPDSAELTKARALVQAGLHDEAIGLLKRLDKSASGKRADVVMMLAIAYYRSDAFKDAEAAAQRVLSLTEDATVLSDAHTVLGRALKDGEKARVKKDSERLRAAEQAFRKALALSEGRSDAAQLALAETLYRLDRGEEARTVLTELLERPAVLEAAAARARLMLASPRCAMEPCLPEMSFVTSEGDHVSPEDLRGRVVVFSFWATWCPPCVEAVPELKRLHSRYANGPFVMIGVNADHEEGVAERFVEKNQMRWAQVIGEGSGRLMSAMAVHAFPTEMVFDHEGVLVGQTRGWGTATGRALADRIGDAIQNAKKARMQSPVATQ
jgi:thiol-disulfide isomerase/thioredoxin